MFACQKSLPRVSIFLYFLFSIILVSPSFAAGNTTDPSIEEQLDLSIDLGSAPKNHAALLSIMQRLNEQTPIESYARSHGYLALWTALTENDKDTALANLDKLLINPRIQKSVTASAEILAVKAEILLQIHDLSASQKLIPLIEALQPELTNPRVLYYTHNVAGRVLQMTHHYADSFKHLTKAHQAINSTHDEQTQRRRQFINLHITRVLISLQNYEAALELTDKTIADSLKYGLHQRLPQLYLNRSYAARELTGPAPEITSYFAKAAELALAQNDHKIALAAFNNAGANALLLKEYETAEHYLLLAREEALILNDVNDSTIINFNLGYIYVLLGNHQVGLEHMRTAAEKYQAIAHKGQIAQLKSYLADAYEVAGHYQLQAQTLKEHRQLKDELFQAERDNAFSELHIRYQAQESALQIEVLEHKNELQRQELDNRQLSSRLMLLLALIAILLAALLLTAYLATRKVNLLLKKNNETLHQQSLLDPLTGLMNRRACEHYLPNERRQAADGYSLFLLDIDHFKHINDHWGHSAGDAVLVEVAKKLKTLCQAEDLVIRWGGEEFLLILTTGLNETIHEFAKRILFEVGSKPFDIDGQQIPLTLSGGFIHHPQSQDKSSCVRLETSLKVADHLLHQAKTTGRNHLLGLTELPSFSETELLQRARESSLNPLIVAGPQTVTGSF